MMSNPKILGGHRPPLLQAALRNRCMAAHTPMPAAEIADPETGTFAPAATANGAVASSM